jgi:hypothetical protein
VESLGSDALLIASVDDKLRLAQHLGLHVAFALFSVLVVSETLTCPASSMHTVPPDVGAILFVTLAESPATGLPLFRFLVFTVSPRSDYVSLAFFNEPWCRRYARLQQVYVSADMYMRTALETCRSVGGTTFGGSMYGARYWVPFAGQANCRTGTRLPVPLGLMRHDRWRAGVPRFTVEQAEEQDAAVERAAAGMWDTLEVLYLSLADKWRRFEATPAAGRAAKRATYARGKLAGTVPKRMR